MPERPVSGWPVALTSSVPPPESAGRVGARVGVGVVVVGRGVKITLGVGVVTKGAGAGPRVGARVGVGEVEGF